MQELIFRLFNENVLYGVIVPFIIMIIELVIPLKNKDRRYGKSREWLCECENHSPKEILMSILIIWSVSSFFIILTVEFKEYLVKWIYYISLLFFVVIYVISIFIIYKTVFFKIDKKRVKTTYILFSFFLMLNTVCLVLCMRSLVPIIVLGMFISEFIFITSGKEDTYYCKYSYADFVLYDDRVIKKIEIANITNENDWVIIAVKEEKDLCEIRFNQNNIKEIKYYGDSCFFIMLGEDKKIYILD